MGRTIAKDEIARIVGPILAGTNQLVKAGMSPDEFQWAVDDAASRARLVSYVHAGCPELPAALLASSASTTEDKFFLYEAFCLTVSPSYIHQTQLVSFREANHQQFSSIDPALNDKNFAKATQPLVPGKTYLVKIFGITQRASSEDCLGLYKTHNGILTSAQGLSLAWQKAKGVFPTGEWALASFDEKDALCVDCYSRPQVPFVSRDSVGDFNFFLGGFEGSGWYPDTHLLVFCELSA